MSDKEKKRETKKERKREGGRNREAIGNSNGYPAKTKLDFYGGQVLIKFGKLEENLGERCRRRRCHHPRGILRLLLPSTARISPCPLSYRLQPHRDEPSLTFHSGTGCRENSISRKWASWHVC